MGSASTEAQEAINAYFDGESRFWNDIYSGTDVYSVIHQHRRALALGWINGLRLPPGARVLEVGCGAGGTAVALAQRGLEVDATDSVPAMVELARRNAEQAQVGERIRTRVADVQALDFPDQAFELVIALGVLPWLPAPADAVREIERVLKPNGSVIANIDNERRLNRLLDPKLNPRLAGLRSTVKRGLGLLGIRTAPRPPAAIVSRQSLAEFDRLLASAGLERITGQTLGFGPFTLLGREVIQGSLGVRLHHRLQTLADRGTPGVRSTGSQYLVLARKSAQGVDAPSR
jgi:ubiquinone/menaquinone biosynthesis C-methylase UbiE